MSFTLTLHCDNGDCRNARDGDTAVDPDRDNCDEKRTLEHDAQLSGWVAYGSAMFCSQKCLEDIIEEVAADLEAALVANPNWIRRNGKWQRTS